VLCWPAFLLVSALGSAGSAANSSAVDCSAAECSALFAGFKGSSFSAGGWNRASIPFRYLDEPFLNEL
jgi:hypothetical protein